MPKHHTPAILHVVVGRSWLGARHVAIHVPIHLGLAHPVLRVHQGASMLWGQHARGPHALGGRTIAQQACQLALCTHAAVSGCCALHGMPICTASTQTLDGSKGCQYKLL